MKKMDRVCMGRHVEYHSPAKHPEQDDPYARMDRDVEQATQSQPGTYEKARKAMKPAQQESSKPAQRLMDYMQKFGGSK